MGLVIEIVACTLVPIRTRTRDDFARSFEEHTFTDPETEVFAWESFEYFHFFFTCFPSSTMTVFFA